MRIMIKDSAGKPSSSVTFAWVSFIWCLVALTIGLIEEITINNYVLKFRMLDAGIVLALLTPSFGLYGFRRWIDQQSFSLQNNDSSTGKKKIVKKNKVDSPD